MEVIIIICIVLGIIKKISDSEKKHDNKKSQEYFRKLVEAKKDEIIKFKNELKKELVWFAFENKRIRPNRNGLPDTNDYQMITIEKIIDQILENDTNIIVLEKRYNSELANSFPLLALENDSLTVSSEIIKKIKTQILQLSKRVDFNRVCQSCEGMGLKIGCTSCGRGKFAIKKNEKGIDICKFCSTKENPLETIDLITCVACVGRGKYRDR